MSEVRIGVYVCHCGSNIGGVVDCKAVAKSAENLPGVVVSRDYSYMCSDPGQKLIIDDVAEHKLTKIVVAACSPRMHEPTFRIVSMESGLSPYFMQMANIREHASWITSDSVVATEKAIDLVRAAVARVAVSEHAEVLELDIEKTALVIGGGVAGIEASLTIARGGYKTYLVEKSATIGGVMAQLDKTFPTLDCSACILTPKMVDVAREPNIELMAYSEVESLDGAAGNFTVKIRKRARFVNNECSGCGACIDACVMKNKFPDEFNYGISKRGAVYIPFPQAVPLKAVVDKETCLKLKKGKCVEKCVKACERGCMDFSQEDEIVEIKVGVIIVATGFKQFDAKRLSKYGYGRYPDVINGLQFERLTNASGPTGGKIVTSKGVPPKTVAIIHCVGSRDDNTNKYCSRVCCMFALKHAHLAIEKGFEVYNFYMDMRAFGKGFEEFYSRIQSEGAHFIRGKVAEITEKDDRLMLKAEDTLLGENIELAADMVILAAGLEPSEDANKLGEILHINKTPDGFYMEQHPKLNPLETPTAAIYVAGVSQGPKDIPDTVCQAKGCAGDALSFLNRGKVKTSPDTVKIFPDACKGCKLCMKLCPYSALMYNEEKKIMEVEVVKCKGCGTCTAGCPAGAISQQLFTSKQIMAELVALLKGGEQNG